MIYDRPPWNNLSYRTFYSLSHVRTRKHIRTFASRKISTFVMIKFHCFNITWTFRYFYIPRATCALGHYQDAVVMPNLIGRSNFKDRHYQSNPPRWDEANTSSSLDSQKVNIDAHWDQRLPIVSSTATAIDWTMSVVSTSLYILYLTPFEINTLPRYQLLDGSML